MKGGRGGVPLLWMKSTKWYLMPSLYDPLDLWIKQLILKPQINTHSTSNSWYRDTAAECRLSPQEQFNLYSTDKRSGLKSWHKGSVKVIRVTCDMGTSHATCDRFAWQKCMKGGMQCNLWQRLPLTTGVFSPVNDFIKLTNTYCKLDGKLENRRHWF